MYVCMYGEAVVLFCSCKPGVFTTGMPPSIERLFLSWSNIMTQLILK